MSHSTCIQRVPKHSQIFLVLQTNYKVTVAWRNFKLKQILILEGLHNSIVLLRHIFILVLSFLFVSVYFILLNTLQKSNSLRPKNMITKRGQAQMSLLRKSLTMQMQGASHLVQQFWSDTWYLLTTCGWHVSEHRNFTIFNITMVWRTQICVRSSLVIFRAGKFFY